MEEHLHVLSLVIFGCFYHLFQLGSQFRRTFLQVIQIGFMVSIDVTSQVFLKKSAVDAFLFPVVGIVIFILHGLCKPISIGRVLLKGFQARCAVSLSTT